MPRYEFSEGTSNKFWEIELKGSSFTTTYGKIGTEGQTTLKTFKSEAEAQKAYEKIIKEKVAKGYELVEGEGGGDEDEDGEVYASEPSASNPELERAIIEDPNNLEARLVYADWLQSQGDPRGEWITMLANSDKDPKLKKAAADLFKANEARFLGPLKKWQKTFDGHDEEAFKWKLGFIEEAKFSFNSFANDDGEVSLADGLTLLLTHPSGKLLERLVIGQNNNDGESYYSDVTSAIAKNPPAALRHFFCADFEYPDDNEMSWTNIEDLSALWAKLPRLESLILQGGSWTLGKLVLPELKHAELRTGGLSMESVQAICSATWPKLERLDIWFGDDNYGAEGGVEDIRAILDGKGLGKLRHLGLMNSQFANDIARALPRAKILPQLEVLDLSMGTMGDEGAAALVENAAAFKHLKRINLNENFLTDATLDRVRALCPNVQVDQMRDGDEDDRYVAVGE